MTKNTDAVSARMASRITGISYGTILNHIKSGLLPTFEEGKRNKIDVYDLEDYAYMMYEKRRYSMYNPADFRERKAFYVDHIWE